MKAAVDTRVRAHGEVLKAAFGLPRDTDPVNLCRKLRRLEREGAALGLRLCNGPEFPTETAADEVAAAILARVDAILHYTRRGVPVILNCDPRGYALKVETEWTEEFNRGRYARGETELHRDMGGYGIVAPDLTEGN
jgi:hypothetical protein